jgi:hypothetical protein
MRPGKWKKKNKPYFKTYTLSLLIRIIINSGGKCRSKFSKFFNWRRS